MKKVTCMLLTAAMVACLAIPAGAAANQSIENATTGETTVTMTAKVQDPQYTILIPLEAEFGTLTQMDNDLSKPINFGVYLADAKFFNGKKLQVTYRGEGENGELVMKNADGDVIPFYVQDSTSHPDWNSETCIFSVLEQNAQTEGSGGAGYGRNLRVNYADITSAGEFSGKMYFDFTFIE